MKKLLAITALIALSIGCKKKDIAYDITGTVIDGTNGNAALSGVTVQLYSTPSGGGTQTYISQQTTASDGTYSFHIERERVESYTLVFNKTNFFDHQQNFTYDDASNSNSSAFNATLYSKGWVRLRFVTADANSTLSITRHAGKTDCDECCGSTFSFSGVTDTTFYCINNGNSPYAYYWFRNGGATHGDTSIVTPAGDTATLLLNY